MTFYIMQSLQNYNSSIIIIYVPNVTIVNPCLNDTCSLIGANTIQFNYRNNLNFNTLMNNPLKPGTYNCSVSILTNNSILLEYLNISYTINQMTYVFSSQFFGFLGQQGQLNINVTKGPSSSVNLLYDVSKLLNSSSCVNCSDKSILLSGIVLYFTTVTLQINGTLNNILYASGTINVSYPCSAGCQICNSTVCIKCLNSTYTSSIYFFNGTCLNVCPAATYSSSTICISCQSNCFNCNVSQCLACISTYILYNGSCLAQCPTGYVASQNTCIVKPLVCSNNCNTCLSET
jgi:hypothetical protein